MDFLFRRIENIFFLDGQSVLNSVFESSTVLPEKINLIGFFIRSSSDVVVWIGLQVTTPTFIH